MVDRSAFLKAILANPDDEAPRLIFADWLDEQGECQRAEFIRVQVKLAWEEAKRTLIEAAEVIVHPRVSAFQPAPDQWAFLAAPKPFRVLVRTSPQYPLMPARFDVRCVSGSDVFWLMDAMAREQSILADPRRGMVQEMEVECERIVQEDTPEEWREVFALRDRERELLGAHGGDWIDVPWQDWECKQEGPIPTIACRLGRTLDSEWTFRRGFVERITLAGDDFVRNVDAIRRTNPLRQVTLTFAPHRLLLRDEYLKADWQERAHSCTRLPYADIFRELWPTLKITLQDPSDPAEQTELIRRRIMEGFGVPREIIDRPNDYSGRP